MSDTAQSPSGSGEEPQQKRRQGRNDDISRLSRSGNSLYELLDIPKDSTDNDIKKKYRRLALKYHPDKNPDNEEAEEMFKKINHANSILSDEKKRQVYDEYGSFGLYISEQAGEECVPVIMCLQSGWFKALFAGCCLFCPIPWLPLRPGIPPDLHLHPPCLQASGQGGRGRGSPRDLRRQGDRLHQRVWTRSSLPR